MREKHKGTAPRPGQTAPLETERSGRAVLWGQRLLFFGGGLSLIYFIGLWIFLGAVYLFQWFWLALGLVLLAWGRALPHRDALPGWFRRLWKAAASVFLAAFLITESLVVSAMLDQPAAGADYVVILGAKVNGTTPSLSLKYRIEAAAEYLLENPGAVAVASGGQGKNEGISEGEAIARSLAAHGISAERILKEEQSTSTKENLLFSKACIESAGGSLDKDSVVVVSSDFHIFRAKALARQCGYDNAEGKSAPSVWGLQPNYCARECFAIWKDALMGNLKFY